MPYICFELEISWEKILGYTLADMIITMLYTTFPFSMAILH